MTRIEKHPSRRDVMKTALLASASGLTATSALPVSAEPASPANPSGSGFRLFDPQGLPPSPGFSQVADVAPGRLLYLSGQVPRNAAGDLVGPGDFRAQLEQVFANLDTALRGSGATFADVVKLNYYCVNSIEPAQQRAVVEVRDRYVNTQSPPASTFVFVSRLVHPGWLIEIEAVALLRTPQPGEVVVLVQMEVDRADLARLIDLTKQMMADTQKEDGCIHYAFAVDVTRPTRLQLSERWRDEAALEAHLRAPSLQRFRIALRDLKVRTTWARRYEASGENLVLPALD